MSWKKTNLKQFAAIYALQTKEGVDKNVTALSIYEYLTGKDPHQQSLETLSKWGEANAWLEEHPKNINRWLWCRGFYLVQLNPAKIIGDDFTTITAYMAEQKMDYIPEVMAKLCRPVKLFGIALGKRDWSKRTELFRNHLTAWQAYGTALFFYRLWTLLHNNGLTYSRSEIRRMRKGRSPKRLQKQP